MRWWGWIAGVCAGCGPTGMVAPYGTTSSSSTSGGGETSTARDPAGIGEPCTVEGNGVSGIDDCDLHSMRWNVDGDTSMGKCIAFSKLAGVTRVMSFLSSSSV